MVNYTISQLPLIQLASGDRLSLQVYKFTGAKPGQKAYIQANLHGAEISGNGVIYELIEFLTALEPSQLTGEICLVPVCNPIAINQRSHHFSTGRYNPYDGKDWNRIFWDYEKEGEDILSFAKAQLNQYPEIIRKNYLTQIQQSFAQRYRAIQSPFGVPLRLLYQYQLQQQCLDANYIIDCHSSSHQALDYLYCFSSREESAKAFLLDHAILMNDYDGDAFDEAFLKPWLALETSFAQLGRSIQFEIESWTLELGGGRQMQPESVAKGVRGIKNYLAVKGMLDCPGFPVPETASHQIKFHPKTKIQEYYAPAGGMVQSLVDLGTAVKSGQILYQLLSFDKNGQPPKAISTSAPDSGLVFDVTTNHSVNQGEYLLAIWPD